MEQPTVAVTGFAEHSVPPDTFTFTASVSVRAGDSGAAHSGLAQRFTVLDQAVMALGADGLEVSRGPVHSWGEGGRLQRWHASRSLTVTGRDLARATEVAAAFGRVADVQVDGPHWQVGRDNPAHAAVQTAAVRDAQARAGAYAAALGGTLGRLAELRDDGGYGHPVAAMAFRAKGGMEDAGLDTMDLSPQGQTLTASVQARWFLVLPD